MTNKKISLDLIDKYKFFQEWGYVPHDAQRQFHDSNVRFRTLTCGRRWGKTIAASVELCAAMTIPETKYWVVAPSYELTDKVFREVYWGWKKKFPQFVEKDSEYHKYIRLTNGSECWGKTADNPDSLLGEGLHGVVADEAARLKANIWSEFLRPTLADHEGWAAFISTPRGGGWFRNLFTLGQDSMQSSYRSWKFPSNTNTANPNIGLEMEEARIRTPERAFRQEWMAEFLDLEGSVFRRIGECIIPEQLLKGIETPIGGKSYVIGVDLARVNDFTVICVMQEDTKQVVYFDRFNQIDWNFQKERIAQAALRYNNALIVVDSTGVGDPIFEDLRKSGLRVQGYKISASSKSQLIDRLAVAIENREISYPEIPELINELTIFEYKQTGTTFKTGAPEGYHDDCVIGLALCLQAIKKVGNFVVSGFNVKSW